MAGSIPLARRPGYGEESPERNSLARELGRLARRHGLLGVVLISFTEDRVGVNSSGMGPVAAHMEKLGDQILTAIDDGKFAPGEGKSMGGGR